MTQIKSWFYLSDFRFAKTNLLNYLYLKYLKLHTKNICITEHKFLELKLESKKIK